MNILDRLFGEKKESRAYAVLSEHIQGQAQTTPRDYKHLSIEGYQKNAIAYRCVNIIANNVMQMNIMLKKKQRNGKMVEVDNHPLVDLFEAPNPIMHGGKYWQNVAAFMQLSGNSYLHAPNLQKGKLPKEIWPLYPDTVKVVPGAWGVPEAYEIQKSSNTVKIPVSPFKSEPSELMHLKTFNPNNAWYGMSPIEAAAFSIDQHNESGLWNVSLLQNMARPSGMLVFKNNLGQEQLEDIKRRVRKSHSGSSNAGKVMVASGSEVDYKQFSFSPSDMDWINAKSTSARDIGTAFGVPSMLLNITGDNTYANYSEARQALWIETIIPLMDDILKSHNQWIWKILGDQEFRLGYDKDELDALAPSRTALWNRVTAARHLSINEKRRATGYEDLPEEEYDQVLVSTSEVPLVYEEEEEEPITPSDLADENGDEDSENPDGNPDQDEDDEEENGKSLLESSEVKMFGLKTQKQRVKTFRSIERKRKAHERRFISQLKAAFEDQAKAVARAVDSGDLDTAITQADAAIAKNSQKIAAIIERNMRAVGDDFGKQTLRSAKQDLRRKESKQEEQRFQYFLESWIKIHSGRRITQVNETTKKKVADAIRLGFQEEEGIPDLAKRIQDSYSGFSKKRATLIARTETVAASNAATKGAAKSLGIPDLKKIWISSSDSRSRDNHRAMDDTKIDIDEKFLVPTDSGAVEMDQPGDPTAPVGEIANCRCTLGFES